MLAQFTVKLMAPAFKNSLTFKQFLLNYSRNIFLKLDNAVTLLPKKKITIFAVKIAKYPTKQLIALKSCDQDNFFCLGLRGG